MGLSASSRVAALGRLNSGPLLALGKLAQNGRGCLLGIAHNATKRLCARRATPTREDFLSCLAAHIRALCALLRVTTLSFLCATAISPSSNSGPWIRIRTPHFDLYTTNPESKVEKTLEAFEQLRQFFSSAFIQPSEAGNPVRVIAFRNESEYRPYRFTPAAPAYFQSSRRYDYIVLQDLNPEHLQAAAHEYVHVSLHQLKMQLPVWLDEGLADLYSTLESRDGHAIIGQAPPGRIGSLATQTWIDLDLLFSVTRDSHTTRSLTRCRSFMPKVELSLTCWFSATDTPPTSLPYWLLC